MARVPGCPVAGTGPERALHCLAEQWGLRGGGSGRGTRCLSPWDLQSSPSPLVCGGRGPQNRAAAWEAAQSNSQKWRRREPFFLSGRKHPGTGHRASLCPRGQRSRRHPFQCGGGSSSADPPPRNLSRHGPPGSLSPCFVASRGHLAGSCLGHKVTWPERTEGCLGKPAPAPLPTSAGSRP